MMQFVCDNCNRASLPLNDRPHGWRTFVFKAAQRTGDGSSGFITRYTADLCEDCEEWLFPTLPAEPESRAPATERPPQAGPGWFERVMGIFR
jgi:hypothetical protein